MPVIVPSCSIIYFLFNAPTRIRWPSCRPFNSVANNRIDIASKLAVFFFFSCYFPFPFISFYFSSQDLDGKAAVMHIITIWLISIISLSHSAFGNPIPEDYPPYPDFFSENAFSFDDFDTSSPIATDLSTEIPDSLDYTLWQPFETSWLTDALESSPDTTQFFTDSSNTPLETSPFAEYSDTLLESSCGRATDGNFQPYSKREDGDICKPKAEVDALPFLKLPDLGSLNKIVGSWEENQPKLRSFSLPPTPGYTVDDDELCPKPLRRLCCQGPLSESVVRGLVASLCRGIVDFFPYNPFILIFYQFSQKKKRIFCEPGQFCNCSVVLISNAKIPRFWTLAMLSKMGSLL